MILISIFCVWRADELNSTTKVHTVTFIPSEVFVNCKYIFKKAYSLARFSFTNCSGCKRHPSPSTVGDAQLHSTKTLGPNDLPHWGGREQCEWQRGRITDVVHCHQNHTGSPEKCQGLSRVSCTLFYPGSLSGQRSNIRFLLVGVFSCPATSGRHLETLCDADRSELARAGEEQRYHRVKSGIFATYKCASTL